MKATLARLAVATAFVSLLAACKPGERVREIDWAKAALARNPAYEILATDESAGVFTVRDTSTGATRTLRLEELVAGPLPPRPAVAKPAAEPAVEPASTPETPVENPEAQPADEPVLAQESTETVPAIPSGGTPVAEGPGYSISRGGAPATAANVEGPGYSITHHDAPKSGGAPVEPVASTNVERRTDPIICQGDRLMRIDGETIEFTGDAVIAEKGCDLFISNAHIKAGGVGIIARQARVHIVNSTIGGKSASYEASDGAEIYVARSTFAGVGRRFDSATMNDLGGNQYKLTH